METGGGQGNQYKNKYLDNKLPNGDVRLPNQPYKSFAFHSTPWKRRALPVAEEGFVEGEALRDLKQI